MNDSIAIVGRQPELSIAELESLYGPANLAPLKTSQAVRMFIPTGLIDFARLGGCVKLCKLLAVIDSDDFSRVERYLAATATTLSAQLPAGKVRLGLSAYGFQLSPETLLAAGLKLKKAIRQTQRSVRLVPNKSTDLNAAQVLHNNLTGKNGCEFVIVRDGSQTLLAQTVYVQDIDNYSKRDFNRPKRDARVGMLPPKLAQIIINLAAGPQEFSEHDYDRADGSAIPDNAVRRMLSRRHDFTVLDPFCGTGVILQEALLMGYKVMGTDLEQRMVDYTQQNLAWLGQHYDIDRDGYRLEAGDATAFAWQPPVSAVATETYLGRPFTAAPDKSILSQTVADCNLIIKKFLQTIYPQVPAGTRFCLAVPAWRLANGDIQHLTLIDHLSELGYNRLSLQHVRDNQLLYFREDQIVARQLLIVTRK